MSTALELIKKYKIFYSGWISPMVLPFWSMVIIYCLCLAGSKVAVQFGFNSSPAYAERWGGMIFLVTVLLASFIGLSRMLIVTFSLNMPISQRSITAVVLSIAYVPIIAFLLAIILWFFVAAEMFVAGMIFGVK
jgi:hypothetical protein